ncbi:hypothetical protein K488DRAFT_74485 [Vararia minispora EC-137]|uniref:Uncharacterized protein n=1 Tax=Vararia minispora EC-137 TaxID=1314806 RepID=A0ACB8Q7N7_9AGAM|nr:hypothetical protein K488DRAFT_74485 [Vararia minispora EC-137]
MNLSRGENGSKAKKRPIVIQLAATSCHAEYAGYSVPSRAALRRRLDYERPGTVRTEEPTKDHESLALLICILLLTIVNRVYSNVLVTAKCKIRMSFEAEVALRKCPQYPVVQIDEGLGVSRSVTWRGKWRGPNSPRKTKTIMKSGLKRCMKVDERSQIEGVAERDQDLVGLAFGLLRRPDKRVSFCAVLPEGLEPQSAVPSPPRHAVRPETRVRAKSRHVSGKNVPFCLLLSMGEWTAHAKTESWRSREYTLIADGRVARMDGAVGADSDRRAADELSGSGLGCPSATIAGTIGAVFLLATLICGSWYAFMSSRRGTAVVQTGFNRESFMDEEENAGFPENVRGLNDDGAPPTRLNSPVCGDYKGHRVRPCLPALYLAGLNWDLTVVRNFERVYGRNELELCRLSPDAKYHLVASPAMHLTKGLGAHFAFHTRPSPAKYERNLDLMGPCEAGTLSPSPDGLSSQNLGQTPCSYSAPSQPLPLYSLVVSASFFSLVLVRGIGLGSIPESRGERNDPQLSDLAMVDAPIILYSVQDARDAVESFRVAIELVGVPSLAVFQDLLVDFVNATKAASSSINMLLLKIHEFHWMVATANEGMQSMCALESTSLFSVVLRSTSHQRDSCKDEHRLREAFERFLASHAELVITLHANLTEERSRLEHIDSVLVSIRHVVGEDVRAVWGGLNAKQGTESRHSLQRRLGCLQDVEDYVSIARRLLWSVSLEMDRMAALLDSAHRSNLRSFKFFALSNEEIFDAIAGFLWNAEDLQSSVREINGRSQATNQNYTLLLGLPAPPSRPHLPYSSHAVSALGSSAGYYKKQERQKRAQSSSYPRSLLSSPELTPPDLLHQPKDFILNPFFVSPTKSDSSATEPESDIGFVYDVTRFWAEKRLPAPSSALARFSNIKDLSLIEHLRAFYPARGTGISRMLLRAAMASVTQLGLRSVFLGPAIPLADALDTGASWHALCTMTKSGIRQHPRPELYALDRHMLLEIVCHGQLATGRSAGVLGRIAVLCLQ